MSPEDKEVLAKLAQESDALMEAGLKAIKEGNIGKLVQLRAAYQKNAMKAFAVAAKVPPEEKG